jgi:hypothetical protein
MCATLLLSYDIEFVPKLLTWISDRPDTEAKNIRVSMGRSVFQNKEKRTSLGSQGYFGSVCNKIIKEPQ